jgi:hypothetical protein
MAKKGVLMSISPEENAKINPQSQDSVCTGGKQPYEYCTRMTLALFNRRKAMLNFHFSSRLNHEAMVSLAKMFHCTINALYKDWEDHENWEPFIWESQKATEDGLKYVHFLQLAREEALYLMQTCRSPNARVGAIGRYIEAVKTEFEIKQSLGIIPKQINPAVMIQQKNQTGSNALMIKGLWWERPKNGKELIYEETKKE